MRRGRVEVPPVLLRVLAVVALGTGEAEDPLLEDRVAAVPECEREAELLPVIADPGEAVLVPPVAARPCMVVRAEVPGLADGVVALADRAQGRLAQCRAPVLPRGAALRHVEKSILLVVVH